MVHAWSGAYNYPIWRIFEAGRESGIDLEASPPAYLFFFAGQMGGSLLAAIRRRHFLASAVFHPLQNRVMFAAGGFGFFARLASYSSTSFNSGPKTQLYISPMLCSSCGSDSILNTLG